MAKATCKIEECTRPAYGHGWCNLHWRRWRETGTTERHQRTVEERFWTKVAKSDGCWEWTGQLNADGYGRLRLNQPRMMAQAHRVAYELLVGPIPQGLDLDHLCRNRKCVNPAHLEPVTRGENVLRGIGRSAQQARQTHCKNGHEFTPENTAISRDGERRCRTCNRAWQREWKRRRAA